MHSHPMPLGPLLPPCVIEALGTQQRASPPTLARDRDTCRLVLECRRDTHGMVPAAAGLAALDGPVLLAFLDPLEPPRPHAIRSRHRRRAAIRSFFRLVARRDPACVHHAARVRAIPVQRADRQVIKARSRAAMDAMLAASARGHWRGRRDHARLWTWSNRGARGGHLSVAA